VNKSQLLNGNARVVASELRKQLIEMCRSTCPPRLHSSNLKMKFKDNIFKALYKLASFAYVEVAELIRGGGGEK
jgi:hypothetical protein